MLMLGTSPALSVRLVVPWTGAWTAEVDLDLPSTDPLPSGPATLSVGTDTLVGTIDPRASGRFGEKARVRILAGAGGWDRTVTACNFQNDAGLLSTAVLSATAAEIRETVLDSVPVFLGTNFVRAAGAASKVFADRDWYVDASGITHVAPRTPIVPAEDLDVLTWDPSMRVAELATDSIVWPNTMLSDLRFGSAVVRDVEQTFSNGRGRAIAWCGNAPASRLTAAFGSLANHAVGTAHLRLYRYRVVAQNTDGRLLLQATKPRGVVPDAMPIAIWPGMAGLSADLTPGTEVLLGFVEGDAAQPVVVAFQSESPVTLTLDATAAIKLGATASSPAAKGDALTQCIADLQSAIAAWSPVAQDGGAALKVALGKWLATAYEFSSSLVRIQ